MSDCQTHKLGRETHKTGEGSEARGADHANQQSVLGPLSEVFGRLGVYHATNILFTVSTLASARSPNLTTLIALRFVAGCAASAPNAVGAGTMADIVPLHLRGKVMSVAVVAPLLGLAVGPMIGGPLVDAFGWRSTVYFTSAAVGPLSPFSKSVWSLCA